MGHHHRTLGPPARCSAGSGGAQVPAAADAPRPLSLMPVLQQTPARQGDVHAGCLPRLDTTPKCFFPLTTHTP